MKPVIAWYGGKWVLSKQILEIINLFPHLTYVEAFGGGGTVLLVKAPSKIEVYNDINSDIVNFYRVLRDKQKFEELKRFVSLTPYSREEFHNFKFRAPGDDDVTWAAKWFVVARQSFSGHWGHSWAFSTTESNRGMSHRVSAYLSAIDRLEDVHKRLSMVQIENSDFRKIIKNYDRETTLFYLDPPYIHEKRGKDHYQNEMTDEDHEELVELLLKIKGKAILSGYDNEIYRRLEEAGWQKKTFGYMMPASRSVKGSRRTVIEVIWFSDPGEGVLFEN